MTTENERVEKLLKGLARPDYESEEHRRQLRERILARIEAGRCRSGVGGGWKTAALLLGLLAVAGVATEVARVALQSNRVRFKGRASDGSYHFSTEVVSTNEDGSVSVREGPGPIFGSSERELSPAEIEQKRKDLEEIETLRRQGAGELVGMFDTWVNGRAFHRTYQFRYVLADGRAIDMGEDKLDAIGNRPDAQLQEQQIAELRQRGQREVDKIADMEFNGQILRSLVCRYTLPDGREVSVGEGDPNLSPPTNFLTSEQLQEMLRLVELKQGTFLGTNQTQAFGKTFIFKKYLYQLADGTVVTQAEGEPQVSKTILNDSDWVELRNLMGRHAGTPLAAYTNSVKGKLFEFAPVRYVLSDGTEVISSPGTVGSTRP